MTQKTGQKKQGWLERCLRQLVSCIDHVAERGPLYVAVTASITACIWLSLLLLDVAYGWALAVGGSVAAVAAFLLLAKTEAHPTSSNTERRWVNRLAFVLIVGFTIWTAVFSSQNVFVTRDPGVYSATAQWLSKNHNFTIENATLGAAQGATSQSLGFGVNPNQETNLYAQGQDVLPLFMSFVNRLFGTAAMFMSVALFGGAALWAVYAFAREWMKPRYALLATTGLSVSMPMIYFSRDAYTEPLSMLFLFAALTLVVRAQKLRYLKLWIAAGLCAGAVFATRIDGMLVLCGFATYFVLLLIFSKPKERAIKLKRYALFWLGAFVPVIVGFLDLIVFSSGYIADLSKQFKLQVVLLAVITTVGLLTVYALHRLYPRYNMRRPTTRSKILILMAVLVVVLSVGLASRPLWSKAEGSIKQPSVPELQSQSRQPIEPKRSYAEQTVQWQIWYAGSPVVVLAAAGSILLLLSARRPTKEHAGLLLLVVAGVGGGVYFIQPSIVPDQIWAIRRFLPTVFPALFVLAAYTVGVVISKLKNTTIVTVVFILAGILLIMPPLTTSRPLLKKGIYQSQLSLINNVCASLSPSDFVIWVGPLSATALQTVRSYCDVPAIGLTQADASQLRAVGQQIAQQGRQPTVLLFANDISYFPYDANQLVRIDGTLYLTEPRTLLGPPKVLEQTERTVFKAIIDITD